MATRRAAFAFVSLRLPEATADHLADVARVLDVSVPALAGIVLGAFVRADESLGFGWQPGDPDFGLAVLREARSELT